MNPEFSRCACRFCIAEMPQIKRSYSMLSPFFFLRPPSQSPTLKKSGERCTLRWLLRKKRRKERRTQKSLSKRKYLPCFGRTAKSGSAMKGSTNFGCESGTMPISLSLKSKYRSKLLCALRQSTVLFSAFFALPPQRAQKITKSSTQILKYSSDWMRKYLHGRILT